MRKNNKIMAYALAGALAISNLSAVAIPMTALAAIPTATSGTKATAVGDVNTPLGASTKVTIGESETFSFDYYHQYAAGNNTTAAQEAAKALTAGATNGLVADDFIIGDNTTPTSYRDAITVNVGAGVLTQANGDTVKWTVTIKADATKLTAAKDVDITVKNGKWDTSSQNPQAADLVHQIKFVGDKGLNSTSNTLGATLTTDATGAQISSTTIEADPNTPDTSVIVGLVAGSKVIKIDGTTTPVSATKAASLNAQAVEYFWKVTSDKEDVVTATVAATGAASTYCAVSATGKDVGTANVKVELCYWTGTGANPEVLTPKTVGSTTITYTVKAQPTKIVATKGAKDWNPATDIELDEKTPSVTLGSKVTATGFNIGQDVTWFQEDGGDKFVTIKQNGNDVTLTKAGNNTTGSKVYVVSNESLKFWELYNKSKKTKENDKLLDALSGMAPADQDVHFVELNVKTSGTDLVVTTDPTSVEILVGGDDALVLIDDNDKDLIPATIAGINAIVYDITSADTNVASIDYTAGDSFFFVKPGKAGETVITLTGSYKVPNTTTGKSDDKTITVTIPVKITDTAANEKALKEAETAKKAAEDAATAAKADAAAQKTAAENASKEATAAKEAASKAATAQKAAEDKAADLEKQLEEAKKNVSTTGIKKGATKAVKGQTFKATSSKAVTLTKIKNAKTVTVGSVVEINNQVYKVTALGKGALKAGKATKLTVDAQFLTKKGINADCAKGTGKIKTLIIKNQTKKAAPAKALVKAVKKYNKKVKVQYK